MFFSFVKLSHPLLNELKKCTVGLFLISNMNANVIAKAVKFLVCEQSRPIFSEMDCSFFPIEIKYWYSAMSIGKTFPMT